MSLLLPVILLFAVLPIPALTEAQETVNWSAQKLTEGPYTFKIESVMLPVPVWDCYAKIEILLYNVYHAYGGNAPQYNATTLIQWSGKVLIVYCDSEGRQLMTPRNSIGSAQTYIYNERRERITPTAWVGASSVEINSTAEVINFFLGSTSLELSLGNNLPNLTMKNSSGLHGAIVSLGLHSVKEGCRIQLVDDSENLGIGTVQSVSVLTEMGMTVLVVDFSGKTYFIPYPSLLDEGKVRILLDEIL